MLKILTTLTTSLLVLALTQTSFSQDTAAKDMEAKKAMMKRLKEANPTIIENTNLSINLSAKKNEFYGGEPIKLDITLKNNGNEKTTIAPIEIENFYLIEVISPFGVPADSLASQSYEAV
ncbi:hypothetical protein B1R32_11245 [Abditibacterium utsteinense]|uniref:Uncharacterized protein n=1 Tax=Abditibacterium utsteinense TaxID=1960156 RepID=A0A2S8SRG8_9BACT|nr:hypothetical protein [Abditibacterium utsteinense]PQV63390.1 hypothetical protein B1R32_11245 [Abditibacterium utsteinense]